MPGDNLNLVLPSLSDPLATIVAKVAAALTAIENDLAPDISAGIININAALPFNGNSATGLGSLQLVAGNLPTAAGYIYYNAGEFYAIDATGVIQLTNNGSINAASVGGIVGDYGGSNPAKVTYVNASHQYQFTFTPGSYAQLVASELTLQATSAAFSTSLQASASAVANTVYTLPPGFPTVQQPLYSDPSGNLGYHDVSGYAGRRKFTSGGTYTPTLGTRRVVITVIGGGGGGGGILAPSSAQPSPAGGGGSGGVGVVSVSSATALTGGSVVVGGGGNGGAAGNNAGSSGAASSIVVGGVTYTANGGTGGSGSGVATQLTQGGSTGGAANCDGSGGANGGPGIGFVSLGALSGAGGSTSYGCGGASVFNGSGSSAGISSTSGFGGGGSGASGYNSGTSQAGGNGGAGAVFVDEYY